MTYSREPFFISKFLFLLVLIAVFSLGCSSKHSRISTAARGLKANDSLESPSDGQRLPFELWGYGQDLQGQSLEDQAIREGDEFLKRSEYQRAMRLYTSSTPSSLIAREALAARVSATALALGRFDLALSSLSDYFKSESIEGDNVTGQLALLLGYGYGANADYDQAFAWFVRAYNTESGSSIYSDASETGIRYLLASIPSSYFESVVTKWKDDQIIGQYILAEQTVRSNSKNSNNYNSLNNGAFWRRSLPAYPVTNSTVANPKVEHLDNVTIGVILPLSGPLSPLGEGTKNGMDIALEAENESKIKIIYRDAQAEVLPSEEQTKQLIEIEKVNAIVGPLLSDQANAVRRITVPNRIPLLSLSKANNFETGEIVFRFGATSNSQMDSLLDAASGNLGMSKFALVYPESPVGSEYATSFKKYINAKGLQIVYEASYAINDSEKLVTIAGELERLAIDGVFIPDGIESARSLLSLLSDNFRMRVRAMGPATWDNPQQLAQSQALFQRSIFVSPFFMGNSNPLVKKFIVKYKNKYGKAPDFLAAQGFDAMTLAIGASRKLLDDGSPFDLAMKGIESYDGLTGSMRVDVSGEVQRLYSVVEVRDGRMQAISKNVEDNNGGEKYQAQQTNQTEESQRSFRY